MVPELQYALGAWGRVLLLRDVGAGAGRRRRADRRRPRRPRPDLPLRPADDDRAAGAARRRPDLRARPVVRADRADRLRQVDAGQGAHPRGRRAARHGLPGRHRPASTSTSRSCAAGSRWCRSAPTSWPARWPRTSRCSTRTCSTSAGRALDELGLGDWVADLPDGLETRLGDGGYVLSAGQEQLVAFARILVRDPHVVILDEATARLDPVTEARVQRATERLLRDRIGIVIAHRLSSVRHCDEVVMLADGQVVEAGPLRDSERFAELLASSTRRMRGRRSGGAARGRGRRRRWRGGSTAPDRGRAQVPAVAGRRPCRPPDEGRPAAAARAGPRPARCGRSSGWRTNDPRFGLGAVVAVPAAWSCSASTARRCRGCGPTWSTAPAALFWPAVGIVAALLITAPIAVLHRSLVPGVVGPADAADQPAPGARPDRPAPGQRPHPGRGGRAGRRHRARGDPRRQRGRPGRLRGHHGRDDGDLRIVRAGAVLRRHDGAVRPGRDAVRAAAGAVGRRAPSRPAPRSRPRWSRRCPRPAR